MNARHWVADFDVATITRQEIAKQYETESGYLEKYRCIAPIASRSMR